MCLRGNVPPTFRPPSTGYTCSTHYSTTLEQTFPSDPADALTWVLGEPIIQTPCHDALGRLAIATLITLPDDYEPDIIIALFEADIGVLHNSNQLTALPYFLAPRYREHTAPTWIARHDSKEKGLTARQTYLHHSFSPIHAYAYSKAVGDHATALWAQLLLNQGYNMLGHTLPGKTQRKTFTTQCFAQLFMPPGQLPADK
jgi:hypothetical protein